MRYVQFIRVHNPKTGSTWSTMFDFYAETEEQYDYQVRLINDEIIENGWVRLEMEDDE